MAKRQSTFDDLISIAAKLPWWVGVVCALASYLVLHLVAGVQIAPPKGAQELGGAILGPFAKMLATIGQYVLPILFLLGATVSAIRQLRQGINSGRSTSTFDDYLRQNKKTGGTPASNTPSNQSDDQIDATCWNARLLAALEWKRFEEVCAGLFERLGFETKVAARGADGGIDICLYQPPSNRAVGVVQCKSWAGKVGVNVVRELRGVMAAEGVAEGTFVTTSTYSDDAIAFASANHIDLMDGKAVLDVIRKLPEEQQTSLLRLATAGDFMTPTCASCGVKMVTRTPKAGGKPFWGCVNYPKCKMILNVAKA